MGGMLEQALEVYMNFETTAPILLTTLFTSLASWRLARLLVHDQIFSGLREFIWRRFPTANTYYTPERVGEPTNSPEGVVARVKSWPFKRWAQAFDLGGTTGWVPIIRRGDAWVPIERDSRIGYLFTCMDCMPVWTSALVTFGYFATAPGTPIAIQTFIAVVSAGLATVFEWKAS